MSDIEQDCITAWNDFADKHGLSKVFKVSAARKSKLKRRLKDVMAFKHLGFHTPYDGWCLALDKIEDAGWMFGGNNRGWKVNFDFMLQESSFIKLMEGGYNHGSGAEQQNRRANTNSSQSGLAGLMDYAAEYYASVDSEPRDSGVQDSGSDQKQGRLFA